MFIKEPKEMKKLLITIIAGLALFCSCDEGENLIQPDNDFSLECTNAYWNDGTIFFPAERDTVIVHVNHKVNANAWQIRCNLDVSWCSFISVVDDLYVIVKPNNSKSERSSWVDVVIGKNVSRINIVQDFLYIPAYEPKPSILPITVWGNDEIIWR